MSHRSAAATFTAGTLTAGILSAGMLSAGMLLGCTPGAPPPAPQPWIAPATNAPTHSPVGTSTGRGTPVAVDDAVAFTLETLALYVAGAQTGFEEGTTAQLTSRHAGASAAQLAEEIAHLRREGVRLHGEPAVTRVQVAAARRSTWHQERAEDGTLLASAWHERIVVDLCLDWADTEILRTGDGWGRHGLGAESARYTLTRVQGGDFAVREHQPAPEATC
ncbi:hypothetical protein [Serinibacter salmoneus]|uniref:Uncharacterized protein n=1 Tax=Serinibacter salmoneus TaxID=556530 RepID=A0A2A9D1I2_9MICO|nr:hypothetical protein [Serinibacter salmoneus]PFG20115.1 hypothetical protein ATL40_1700 [Serinibacter salmoneus]